MRKKIYRAVVAAVLVGAVLFSPLLCGKTCLEARGGKQSEAAEVVAPAAELAGEFAKSAVVGCVLTHVVLSIDVNGWTDVLNDGNWLWVGVEAVELVRGVLREGLLRM
jgi:sirohydrochlorin ferrochelatase